MVFDRRRQLGVAMKEECCSEALAKQAQLLPISEAVPLYEKLVSRFPTAAKYWKQYVEAYMAVNDDTATKKVFSRCLLICFDVSLWHCYIRFIRKVNHNKGVEGQEETRRAFEFMLNCVGTDISSAPLWSEYIGFLKSSPPSTDAALVAQAQEERTAMVRKAYQSALLIPTHQLEQLWKDYQIFEISVSPVRSKGILSELQPKHNSAKAVYRERNKYVDQIDWNMLPLPSTGSSKEQQLYTSWKRFLAFEKGNPQRIDVASSNKRIAYTYEQCLMHLHYYPDMWYDYAMWQAKAGSIDATAKVFQRALKALPDSHVLWYAYAEMEECRGDSQSAKRIYETILSKKGVGGTSLAHVHFMRFLRRTEGVEAARNYFLGIRNSPDCAYHVYVAYATIAFSLDKDPKVAVNVFEAGMKRFMTEPAYILQYADFLCRLNDDKNVRALYERALSSLSSEDSVEVWKSYTLFEKTHGDLATILKVEQRMKDALSRTGEEGSSSSLEDVVSRYTFLDLYPFSCSNTSPTPSAYPPNTSQMVMEQVESLGVPSVSSTVTSTPSVASVGGGPTKPLEEILKYLSPALVEFITHLPAAEGPSPNVDMVLSTLLQSNIPTAQTGQVAAPPQQSSLGPVGSASDGLSGSNKSHYNPSESSRESQSGKRKNLDRHEDGETGTVQSRSLPRDAFMIRQIQKARKVTTSQTGSTSGGSMVSGELSGST